MIKKADDQVKYLVINLSGCHNKKSGKWRVIKNGFINRSQKKTKKNKKLLWVLFIDFY